MKPESLLAFEKVQYPTGVFSNMGENLHALVHDESSYTPPVRSDTELQKTCPIIVPTHRDIRKCQHTIHAIMELSRGPIIFLCSGKARKEDIAAIAKEHPHVSWVAIDGPYRYDDFGQDFETTYSTIAFESKKDIAQKRNFGLLIARLMGWQAVLFLDDDIVLTKAQFYRTIDLLYHRDVAVVGFSARSFPDNSVTVHARRLANGPIDSFIGSGAMAVRTDRKILSFFPHIYNEDWLFLATYCLLGSDNDVVWAGTVNQRSYDPFHNASRALQEEPGDILGESLIRLAMSVRTELGEESDLKSITKKLIALANKSFWENAINDRIAFIQETQTKLQQKFPHTPKHRRALQALRYSLERLMGTEGSGSLYAVEFSQWMEAWVRDLERWNNLQLSPDKYKDISEVLLALKIKNDFLQYTTEGKSTLPTPLPIRRNNNQEKDKYSKRSSFSHSYIPIAPHKPNIKQKLEHTRIMEEYLHAKGYKLEHIVESAERLRFDRPTKTLSNNKPFVTISMIVSFGESIEQIALSLRDVVKKGRVSVPVQFVVWVCAPNSHSSREVEVYRNRITARLVGETASTNVFIRSSIILDHDSNVDHIISNALSEMAFAYWNCKIPINHQFFVVNSRNDLLRHGTFWDFMRGEHKIAHNTVTAYLRQLPKIKKIPLILDARDDELALITARHRLASAAQSRKPFIKISTHPARVITKQMHRASLTWLQTDDLAHNFQFHHNDGEDSLIPVKKAMGILVNYTDDLPSDKYTLARRIISAINQQNEMQSLTIVICGTPDTPWKDIELYRSRLIKAIEDQKANSHIVITSLTYRPGSYETFRLYWKRIQAVTSYVYWLQNNLSHLRITWHDFSK